jgi:hypothetical protein
MTEPKKRLKRPRIGINERARWDQAILRRRLCSWRFFAPRWQTFASAYGKPKTGGISAVTSVSTNSTHPVDSYGYASSWIRRSTC